MDSMSMSIWELFDELQSEFKDSDVDEIKLTILEYDYESLIVTREDMNKLKYLLYYGKRRSDFLKQS